MSATATPTATQPILSACPECDAAVNFTQSPLRGEVARCRGCNAELEVTGLEPLRLELAPAVEEDWGE